MVASTDLSHYYPYDAAVKIDSVTLEHLKNFDIAGMVRDTRTEKAQACGAGHDHDHDGGDETGRAFEFGVEYANSGDVSGDRSGVVGYVSASFI